MRTPSPTWPRTISGHISRATSAHSSERTSSSAQACSRAATVCRLPSSWPRVLPVLRRTSTPDLAVAATKQALSTIGSYFGLSARSTCAKSCSTTPMAPATPRQLIPLLVRAAIGGEEVRLGAAEQPIDLTYLDDVAEALTILLRTPSPALTTIRADSPVTVGEIVGAIANAAGQPLRAQFAEGARTSDQPLVAGDWPLPPDWSPQGQPRRRAVAHHSRGERGAASRPGSQRLPLRLASSPCGSTAR